MAIKKISNDAYKLIEAKSTKHEEVNPLYKDLAAILAPSPSERKAYENIKNDKKLWELTKTEPVLMNTLLSICGPTWYLTCQRGHLWLYQNCLYEITDKHYTEEEMKLMVLDTADKERQKFERLRTKFDSESSKEIRFQRPRIPEEIRIAVWRRDQGRCVRCSKQENLEYDHIIPVSKGGSNTVRNIELLCEKCNREKGNRVQ